MRIVVPFGFYGAGNIGDEATLQGFAQLLAQSGARVQVSVASRNPAHTSRVEPTFRYFHSCRRDPRRWLAKLSASAHVMVGGTPIMDVLGDWPLSELVPLVRSIDRWKVPLVFLGIGAETLRSDKLRQMVAQEIAPRVRHWSVRCERDMKRLIDYGVAPDAITVAADMAWLIEPATPDFGLDCLAKWNIDCQRPLIGVNLVNENSVFDQQPQMTVALAQALDELVNRMDAQVIFLSNEVREDSGFDRAAATKIIHQMSRKERITLAPSEYFAPQQMMSIISCCSLTVSMRYHFCLFSALQRVPFIAVRRSDKLSDLCWDLDWTASVVPPQVCAMDLVGYGMRLRETADAVDEQLNRSVQSMRHRALRNVAALNALKSHLIYRDRRVIALSEKS